MPNQPRLRARDVLADCWAAYEELKQASDPDVYRRRWVCLVTLLRAVGNVLKEVDAEQNLILEEVISDHWTEDSPRIFTEFIVKTRASTIKQYRSGALLLGDVTASPMSVQDTSVMGFFDGPPGQQHTMMALSETSVDLGPPIPYVFGDGPFRDKSVYSVIDDALKYWDEYLLSIERAIEAAGGSGRGGRRFT